MDAQIVGNKIAELRKNKGMTQAQLAGMLSLTNRAVSKWETGRSLPDIATLPKLATALGVSIGDILDCSKDTLKQKKSTVS